MYETGITALATFFATIGPFNIAAVFAALTANQDFRSKTLVAIKGTLIAGVILIIFALSGETLLTNFGISLAALRTAGGILLLLIGIDLVFVRSSGGISTTDDETREAETRQDITVFPLAMPMIAGPGAMGASILLMANTGGDLILKATVIAALVIVLVFTLLSLFLAAQIQRVLGVTGMHVISRVFGILLTALAVQFIFDGIAQSGLLD
ncbi:MAG: MarC family protein [Proteobacteria bacterium]|nr:MarC family protein [Pseudomonadota bacterium]